MRESILWVLFCVRNLETSLAASRMECLGIGEMEEKLKTKVLKGKFCKYWSEKRGYLKNVLDTFIYLNIKDFLNIKNITINSSWKKEKNLYKLYYAVTDWQPFDKPEWWKASEKTVCKKERGKKVMSNELSCALPICPSFLLGSSYSIPSSLPSSVHTPTYYIPPTAATGLLESRIIRLERP